jgi:anti-sigma factor RsiW
MTGFTLVTDDVFDVAPGHIASAELARFIDGILTPTARQAVVAHLAECADCRHEVVELREALAASMPRTRPRARWTSGVLAAAAVLLIAVLVTRPVSRNAAVVRAELGEASDGQVSIIASLPAENQTLEREAVRFAWRRAGADATYLLTVQDTTGRVVWSTQLADTSATPPRTAPLVGGQRYFWSVDARLGDGQSRKGGVSTFLVR